MARHNEVTTCSIIYVFSFFTNGIFFSMVSDHTKSYTQCYFILQTAVFFRRIGRRRKASKWQKMAGFLFCSQHFQLINNLEN